MTQTKWVGLGRWKRRCAATPDAVYGEQMRALVASATDLVAQQRRLAPIDDGDLRRSITWRFDDGTKIAYSQGAGKVKEVKRPGKGKRLAVRISAGNTRVRYPHIVEFGSAPHIVGGIYAGAQHPGTDPQPYFFPPYRAAKRRIRARARRALKKGIAAAARSAGA